MVNPGHASRGCATCRARRVKCDERVPTCAKCEKSKRLCIGYSRQTSSRSSSLESDNASKQALSRFDGQVEAMNRLSIYQRSQLYMSEWSNSQTGLCRADVCTLGAIGDALESLQQPSQSIQTRRELHKKYQLATYQLRNALFQSNGAKAPWRSICLFALYEMIVNTSAGDKTWETHLDGLLAIMKDTAAPGSVSSLHRAAQAMRTPGFVERYLASSSLSCFERASLIIDMAKLQLRDQMRDGVELGQEIQSLRQIDLVKLRGIVKQFRRALDLAAMLLDQQEEPDMRTSPVITDMRYNELRTLRIVTANILCQIGVHLQARTHPRKAFDPTKLHLEIMEATDGIYTSAMSTIEERGTQRSGTFQGLGVFSTDFGRILGLIWPLFCALRADGISTTQRRKMETILWKIADEARLPFAMTMDGKRNAISDTLSGLLIVGISMTEMLPCI